ncbi:MAG TPA: hypothetical protein EYG92_06225 [Lutibacter sp.]|nr:hypothetical protein [Lutibacter sp.]
MIAEDIKKIKCTDTTFIADVLGLSSSQARRYKKGESGLSNSQALLLEDTIALSPRAFDAIHLLYTNSIKTQK